MRPLRHGLFYWENERCIDRLEAFAKRVTRERSMTSGELSELAYRVAVKLISIRGAAVSLRAFERNLGCEYRDDDVIRNGKNVSAKNRQDLERLLARQEKDKRIADARNLSAIHEAVADGRKFVYVSDHQFRRRYGLITRNTRRIKRETAAIEEIKQLSRELKSLIKERQNVE